MGHWQRKGGRRWRNERAVYHIWSESHGCPVPRPWSSRGPCPSIRLTSHHQSPDQPTSPSPHLHLHRSKHPPPHPTPSPLLLSPRTVLPLPLSLQYILQSLASRGRLQISNRMGQARPITPHPFTLRAFPGSLRLLFFFLFFRMQLAFPFQMALSPRL